MGSGHPDLDLGSTSTLSTIQASDKQFLNYWLVEKLIGMDREKGEKRQRWRSTKRGG